ncbi:MAG TPA: hypothetical protein VD978_12840 [Azospirillum sp.]|nr:hypothetical protein [Azospirillum sp.]
MTDANSIVLASHTDQVAAEASASPIITACTTGLALKKHVTNRTG